MIVAPPILFLGVSPSDGNPAHLILVFVRWTGQSTDEFGTVLDIAKSPMMMPRRYL
jgi:hypothetical protein